MTFLLENISINSKPEEYQKFKRKYSFIKSMEKEMGRQFTKSKVKQVFVPEKPKSDMSMEAWMRTVFWYGDFDVCRLADSNVI